MSSATKKNVGDAATAPPATSAKAPAPAQSAPSPADPHVAPTPRPPRLSNLAALLARENVEFALVVAGAKTIRLGAEFYTGDKDAKTFALGSDVGDDGCLLLIRLSDNPAGVGAGFYEIRPPAPNTP